MDTVGLLLKDPPFWAAAAAFIAGFSAFLWSAVHLRRSLASPAFPSMDLPSAVKVTDKDGKWSFPPPEQPPVLPPDMESTVKMSAPAAVPGSRNDPSVAALVEEKFSELAKRVASLEHPKVGQAPAYLEPLLKRFQEMENEVKNLKFAFTQLASAQNAINVGDITAKIQAIQKMLENLTGGTDVSKPS